ncbi:diacylglycerol kinase [Terribacillus saccharophilus]|uniref:Diacylglycerol kinase n=1 Tax=Terribacillus saccharophilus TaxID=361277 RepID=A0A268AB68_9BACI|nr:diacylglycerol kinase [Terribacillus saccharophilus]PAD21365.1 diacylglycerol kinase [Terribacillus saccharophilus]PAF16995.1 diacylglycerol kinase [Terribacillus saccharophilus]PAF21013.1 diacylglycerol kinase [Terribacillus saccharophilus]PAF39504.1 diacylglycerol kinase [Terribacillus saccharophilus]
MKRARIIYNPTSGKEAFRRELPDVLEIFEKAGYETSTHATTCEGDATAAARLAVERGYDLVVACGGDGTVNEVVSGLAEQPNRPKLGIIPVGTTNDLARALFIPRNIKRAAEIIVEGRTRKLDIGKVNDHYFMNIAGGGKLTELTYDVPSKTKTMLGQMAYYLKGIEMLPSLRPIKVEIEYDGKWFEDEIMLFLVSNTNSVGGFEKLAPDALLDDGLFDLVILRKTNIAEFIRIASLAIRGAHLDHDLIFYTRANRIKVKPADKMQLNIDGEYGGLLPGEFVNLHQHIEYFVSEEFIQKQDSLVD